MWLYFEELISQSYYTLWETEITFLIHIILTLVGLINFNCPMQLKFFSFVITSDIYAVLRWPKSNYKMTMIQLHRQIIQEYLKYFYYWNLRLCVKIFKRIHFYHSESIALNTQFHVQINKGIYFWYRKFFSKILLLIQKLLLRRNVLSSCLFIIRVKKYKNKKLETRINGYQWFPFSSIYERSISNIYSFILFFFSQGEEKIWRE